MPSQPQPIKILILGGTGDAAILAQQATSLPHFSIITSLAGRTHQPLKPTGTLRVGGFGGVTGLCTYLENNTIHGLIDATHPFAQQMSWNAFNAATTLQIPFLRLERSPWKQTTGDRWIEVPTLEAAAVLLPDIGVKRVFLTIGRQHLAPFVSLQQLWFLVRSIDPPEANQTLPNSTLLLERGPFSLAHERDLLQQYQIEAIVSKNSGGSATYAKIQAARELQVPVVIVQRPPMPTCETVPNAEEAIQWLLHRFKQPHSL